MEKPRDMTHGLFLAILLERLTFIAFQQLNFTSPGAVSILLGQIQGTVPGNIIVESRTGGNYDHIFLLIVCELKL